MLEFVGISKKIINNKKATLIKVAFCIMHLFWKSKNPCFLITGIFKRKIYGHIKILIKFSATYISIVCKNLGGIRGVKLIVAIVIAYIWVASDCKIYPSGG